MSAVKPNLFPSAPARPAGSSAEARFMQMMWDMAWDPKCSIFVDSPGIHFDKTSRGYMVRILPPKNNASGFRWQVPLKELDPTRYVPKDVFVYITSGNPLVVAGMIDVVDNTLVHACEGVWQAAQSVQSQTGDTPPKYNVPVFPYPSASGTVTGAPGNMQGDLDNDAIFWIYWGQVAC